jgi:hypothetical protein
MVSLKQHPGGHTFEDNSNVEKLWYVADNKGHGRILAENVKAKHDTRLPDLWRTLGGNVVSWPYN